MTERDFISEMFADRVSNPLEWFKHSRALIAAARITKERADMIVDRNEQWALLGVSFMLYGFSIENLFKAVLTLRKFGPPHSEGWVPEAHLPKEIKTHDLCALATLIGDEWLMQFDTELKFLTDAATYSGRYPTSATGAEGTHIMLSYLGGEAEKIYAKYNQEFTISR